jgi:hypothetical protein
MKINLKSFLLLFVFAVAISGCKKDDVEPELPPININGTWKLITYRSYFYSNGFKADESAIFFGGTITFKNDNTGFITENLPFFGPTILADIDSWSLSQDKLTMIIDDFFGGVDMVTYEVAFRNQTNINWFSATPSYTDPNRTEKFLYIAVQ